MDNFLNYIRKPSVWIYMSVIYLWLVTIAKLFASVAPPFLIAKIADTDNSLSDIEINKALMTYIQEGANELGINSHYLFYSIVANIIILLPILVIGFFILRRKSWARRALIVLLILLVFMPTLLSAFTSEVSLRFLNFETLIYLAIIYLLTRKSTKEYFIEKNT